MFDQPEAFHLLFESKVCQQFEESVEKGIRLR